MPATMPSTGTALRPQPPAPSRRARHAGHAHKATGRSSELLARGRRALLCLALAPVDLALAVAGPRYRAFIWLLATCPPRLLAALGRWRALRAYEHATRTVPAYRRFIAAHDPGEVDPGRLRLPATDKANYVRRYPIPERCAGGALPRRGVAIDESSGSTGTPYNWVRSREERTVTHLFISHFTRYSFGDAPWVTINAFSMGAWATGANMGVALQRNGVVKNTGPDVDKILGTLTAFGSDRPYLVCGYPPFLKHLIDAAAERGFPLGGYRLAGLVGGEGMAEGLRDYLSQVFTPVYSGYGATDLEIGMAGETPLCVALRRAARDDPRLPMLFQYNPLSHHITVTADGELVVTISRLHLLSPRIAYNIHDQGGAASYAELERRCRAAGRSLGELAAAARLATPAGPASRRPLRLPFLWVHGRTDSTISVMGANVYPEDLEQALYNEPALAAVTSSFCLGVREEPGGALRPRFSFEVRAPITAELRRAFQERVVAQMQAMNADFRTAMLEHAGSVTPAVELHPPGGGPFAADQARIKQVRLLRGGA